MTPGDPAPAFGLADERGRIEQAWPKISPKDTPKNLLRALAT